MTIYIKGMRPKAPRPLYCLSACALPCGARVRRRASANPMQQKLKSLGAGDEKPHKTCAFKGFKGDAS